ncbi:MAG TPA: hypothetical protein VI259_11950 [Gemmatimonadaceae bacterium]
MRTIRALTIASAIAAVLPATASAQQGRQFKDAWFWGVKGGGFALADTAQQYKTYGLAGVDWVITRTHAALYISGSQAFFTQQAFAFRDPNSPADSGLRAIDLKNMRKLDMALLAFPGRHDRFHPYAGAGFTVAQVASATPQGPFGSVDQITYAQAVVQDRKVSIAPMFIAGLQARLSWFSVFAQGTAMVSQNDFILYNGRPWNMSFEAGLRYNVGTSIDRN